MGAKIRTAELNKIPIMIIIGEQEKNNNTMSVRKRFSGSLGSLELADFINSAVKEISQRLNPSNK